MGIHPKSVLPRSLLVKPVILVKVVWGSLVVSFSFPANTPHVTTWHKFGGLTVSCGTDPISQVLALHPGKEWRWGWVKAKDLPSGNKLDLHGCRRKNSRKERNTQQKFINNTAEVGTANQCSAWPGGARERSFSAWCLCLAHTHGSKLIFFKKQTNKKTVSWYKHHRSLHFWGEPRFTGSVCPCKRMQSSHRGPSYSTSCHE